MIAGYRQVQKSMSDKVEFWKKRTRKNGDFLQFYYRATHLC